MRRAARNAPPFVGLFVRRVFLPMVDPNEFSAVDAAKSSSMAAPASRKTAAGPRRARAERPARGILIFLFVLDLFRAAEICCFAIRRAREGRDGHQVFFSRRACCPCSHGSCAGVGSGSTAERARAVSIDVLALSWSPSFCAASAERAVRANTSAQCGARPIPLSCMGCGRNTPRVFLSIARSRRRARPRHRLLYARPDARTALFFNEWGRHGTCSAFRRAPISRPCARRARSGKSRRLYRSAGAAQRQPGGGRRRIHQG